MSLSPDQFRKVNQIKAALDKSDNVLKDHLISITTFERSAVKAQSGRVFAEWPRRIAGLQEETLRARGRLDKLDTGLRAQHRLHDALTELAAAFGAWHSGLASNQTDEVDAAKARMQRHFASADRLGKAALNDLKRGR
jgi:hypothetical protein